MNILVLYDKGLTLLRGEAVEGKVYQDELYDLWVGDIAEWRIL